VTSIDDVPAAWGNPGHPNSPATPIAAFAMRRRNHVYARHPRTKRHRRRTDISVSALLDSFAAGFNEWWDAGKLSLATRDDLLLRVEVPREMPLVP
jgi:hypothetical protein